MSDVVKARFCFDPIFGNKFVRGVTVVTGGSLLMPGVKPALINAIHHMAVVTGGGIVTQIGYEFGRVRENSQHCNGRDSSNQKREVFFHFLEIG